jgi:hypothetical protein
MHGSQVAWRAGGTTAECNVRKGGLSKTQQALDCAKNTSAKKHKRSIVIPDRANLSVVRERQEPSFRQEVLDDVSDAPKYYTGRMYL